MSLNSLLLNADVVWCIAVFFFFFSFTQFLSFPLQDAADVQTGLDVLAGESKSEVCDMPCQMQLAVESVELSVESPLNGHIVPEVSIEG